MLGDKGKPMDWSPYGSLAFDAFNATEKEMKLGVRMDDANSIDSNSRFTVDDMALPPGKTTPVKIDI